MQFTGDLQGFEMLLTFVGLIVVFRLTRVFESSPNSGQYKTSFKAFTYI